MLSLTSPPAAGIGSLVTGLRGAIVVFDGYDGPGHSHRRDDHPNSKKSSKRSPRARGPMTTKTEADEMLAQLPEGPRDYAVLVGRLLLGVVMFAFGWEKWVTKGLSATAVGMKNNGVPFPVLSATFAGTVELLGGALLILGALT